VNDTLTTTAFLCTYTNHYHVTDVSTSTVPGQVATTATSTCWPCTYNRSCQTPGWRNVGL